VKSIKTLGIAVLAALALTAFAGASAASANYFKSASASATWSGSRIGSNHQLVLGGEVWGCKNVSFNGTSAGLEASQLTVTPELGSCGWLGSEGSWGIGGCKLRFHPGLGIVEPLVGSVDIVGCTTSMTFNYTACTYKVGNQNGLGTVEYKNSKEGGVEVITAIAKLTGITFTREGAGCAAGGPGTFNNGTYSGEWKVKGSAGGLPSSISVQYSVSTAFAAEEAPVTISGVQSSVTSNKRIIAGFGLKCESFTLNGTSASASTSTLTLTPGFKKCTWGGSSIADGAVSAGGCSYVLHLNEKFDIVGASCAANPITITIPECVTTIGPQSGLMSSGSNTYTNNGSAKSRTVSVSGNPVQNLTYTAVGAKCFKQGTFSDGSIQNIASLLSGTNSKAQSQGLWVE
jgi:hypothetical protein